MGEVVLEIESPLEQKSPYMELLVVLLGFAFLGVILWNVFRTYPVCPYCREIIDAEATKCPHCASNLK